MEAIHGAFQGVCDILPFSCDRDDPLTEIVVKIAGLAKAGEREPEILCIDVLSQLETPRAPPARPETTLAAQGNEPD
jgi:hypothetical protein